MPDELTDSLDTNYDIVQAVADLGGNVIAFLRESYLCSTRWRQRHDCIYFCIGWVREDSAAIDLAKLALRDRSKMVRYRACQALAYSLDDAAIPALQELAETSTEERTVKDAKAAIMAIKGQNHNYFLDRERTGRVFWDVMQVD